MEEVSFDLLLLLFFLPLKLLYNLLPDFECLLLSHLAIHIILHLFLFFLGKLCLEGIGATSERCTTLILVNITVNTYLLLLNFEFILIIDLIQCLVFLVSLFSATCLLQPLGTKLILPENERKLILHLLGVFAVGPNIDLRFNERYDDLRDAGWMVLDEVFWNNLLIQILDNLNTVFVLLLIWVHVLVLNQ